MLLRQQLIDKGNSATQVETATKKIARFIDS